MPTGRGYETISGFGVESVYGTEVVVTQRFPMRSEGIDDTFEKLADQVLEGSAVPRTADQGVKSVGPGAVPANFRYTTGSLLLQHFFGDLTTGTYSMQENLEGDSLTWAIEKGVSVWTYSGVKCDQIEIAGSPSDQVTITPTLIAQDVVRNSVTNTTAVLAALTDAAANLLFTHLNFRIGDLVDALAVGDEFGISDFTITCSRNMIQQWTNESRNVIEPLGNDRRLCTFTFTIPRYTVDTFQSWKDADTKLQARLFFDDSTNTKEILLPELTLDTAPVPIAGAAIPSAQLTATCYRNLNNANMVTGAVEIEINET